MNEIEIFGEKLVDFIYQTNLKTIPSYLYDDFLNYLGVTYLGANHKAVSIVLETLLDDHDGKYQPFCRKESVSLSDVALVDCFSSAIQAYDDIHFETTIHPCGPVLSAILALSRKRAISLFETLNALYIGMEVECRLATALFSKETDSHSGWYTTGLVGSIGAVSALSHLLKFNKEQIKSAIGLSCNYASGIRGSHGSMTGSFVPAIASKNGFVSAMLIEKGMTCSFQSLVGENGLIKQITNNPAIQKASDGLGQSHMASHISCKPYPYGFISFGAISLLMQLDIDFQSINNLTVEVSSRVKNLGSNYVPKTMYDGFVSLPYIIASILVNRENAYLPLKDDFIVSSKIKDIMKKITIKENEQMNDDEIYILINNNKYYLKDAYGSINRPMQHEEIIEKFKRITNIKQKELFLDNFYHHDIQNIYQFIIDFFE